MRHQKAENLANDKAYQLLVEKLPKKFEPLEKRHQVYLTKTSDGECRCILQETEVPIAKNVDPPSGSEQLP